MSSIPEPGKAPAVFHSDALPVGTRLGEFEIVALLGVGGFGMVYRAFDHSLHRAVAIKEYMPSAMAGRGSDAGVVIRSSGDEPSFHAGLQSFVAEARLLAQFDHPSLVKVFRFWEENNTAYMVMPLYSGMTLKQARNQMREPPSEAWLRKVLWSVLGALRTLHEANTLHRDVSPDNIFVQDVGPPVLLDLGAARMAITSNSRRHTAVLKVNYAPIEQYADADDLRQGPWTDLYSLAAVVHSCLSNVEPLPSTFRVVKDRMRTCTDVAKTLREQLGLVYSAQFVTAVDQALMLYPDARPQTIDDFADALKLAAPPEGLTTFDWRSELGDVWQGPNANSGQIRIANTVNAAEARAASLASAPSDFSQTLPASSLNHPDVSIVDTPATAEMKTVRLKPPVRPERLPSSEPPVARRSSRQPKAAKGRTRVAGAPAGVPWALLLLGALVLVSIAYAVVALKMRDKSRDDDIITEMAPIAVGSATPASAPASALLTPGAEEVILAGSATALVATEAAAVPAESPASVAAAASAAVRAAARAAAAQRPVRTALPPLVSDTAALAPAPTPPPVASPSPPVAARAQATPNASAANLCADANFFTKTMCMHQECQKPAFTRTAVCTDFRRKMEESRNREP